ncbi:MAG: MBOAT family O-acyltransferase [Thermoanaerobaculaceae bacterium]
MPFQTAGFWLAMAAVVAVHQVLRERLRVLWLLTASWALIAWWDARCLAILLALLLVTFLATTVMPGASLRRRRVLLGVVLAATLGTLVTFKYLGFFADSARLALRVAGLEPSFPVLHLGLPLGLSFFVLLLCGYAIDVYRGTSAPTRDLPTFLLFGSFFPQLAAGPIPRASELVPQLERPRRAEWEDLRAGGLLILLGLFRKIGVADALAPLVDLRFAQAQQCGGLDLLIAVYLYAVQIYCDFAGYTDLARGTSRLLGITLAPNFHQPYLARSITDFWRRWHATLSSWLRDHVFLPLDYAALRRLPARRVLGLGEEYWAYFGAVLVTMLACGLWHGASWAFVAWGGVHGVLLCAHRAWLGLRRRGGRGRPPRALHPTVSAILTFHAVAVAWILFRAGSFEGAGTIVARIVSLATAAGVPPLAGLELWRAAILASVVLMVDVLQRRTGSDTFLLGWRWPWRGLAYATLAMLTLVLGGIDARLPFVYALF